MRKMLSDSIWDLGKCPNQKTHESESAGFLLLLKVVFIIDYKALWGEI